MSRRDLVKVETFHNVGTGSAGCWHFLFCHIVVFEQGSSSATFVFGMTKSCQRFGRLPSGERRHDLAVSRCLFRWRVNNVNKITIAAKELGICANNVQLLYGEAKPICVRKLGNKH